MSYIKGTNLEALINRTIDGMSKMLGFEEEIEEPTPPKKDKKKKKRRKKVKSNEQS